MSENAKTLESPREASLLKPAVNLAMVGLMASLILAVSNYFTAPIRIRNEKLAEEEARRAVLPAAHSFEEIPQMSGWLIGKSSDGKTVGYVLPVVQRGYDGNIHMLLGVDGQFAVVDFKILKDRETPGLGAKAKEEPFRKQFLGRKKDRLELTRMNEPGKIQAITGATITSRAIVTGIKRELERLEKLAQGGFSDTEHSAKEVRHE